MSSVFLSLAERTWCGRALSFLSELHPSLFRQITALRRRGSAMSAQSACRRRAPALACAIPHLQRRGAPFRRELEEQMRIAALLESSRHSNVEDRLRPVALQAGEWECRCVRGTTSRWSRGGLGGAPRVQRSLPWTSRVRRSDWHTCIPLRRWPEAAHPRGTAHLHTRQPARPEKSESGAGGSRPSEPPRQLARATQAGGRTSDQPASACLPSDQIEAEAARCCCSDSATAASYDSGPSMIGCAIRTLRSVHTLIDSQVVGRERAGAGSVKPTPCRRGLV